MHTAAVQDAVTRAQRYSDALGLGKVRPVAIGDAGMLGRSPEGPSGPGMVRALAAPAGGSGGPQLEFAPADIEVSASVDAKFQVGQP